jgi:hypothetical protein
LLYVRHQWNPLFKIISSFQQVSVRLIPCQRFWMQFLSFSRR